MARKIKGAALALLWLACSTTRSAAPYQSPALNPTDVMKLVFLPTRVAVEIDGQSQASYDEAAVEIQSELERAVALEHYTSRYVFAASEDAKRVAGDIKDWLDNEPVCSETMEPRAGYFPALARVAAPLGAGAAVYLDARLYLTSRGRKVGQAVASTLIAAAVAAVIVLVAIAAKDSRGPDCSGASARVAVDLSNEAARVAVEQLRTNALRPACKKARDKHGFWTGNHLDLAVAVVRADGELLWYRAGKFGLDTQDTQKNGRALAAFLEGMP